eukprot:307125-Rhodomonas_salina.3
MRYADVTGAPRLAVAEVLPPPSPTLPLASAQLLILAAQRASHAREQRERELAGDGASVIWNECVRVMRGCGGVQKQAQGPRPEEDAPP